MECLKAYQKKLGIAILLAIIVAFIGSQLLTNSGEMIQRITTFEKTEIFFSRFTLIFLLMFFLLLHFVVPLKKLYTWIFDKRYCIAVAFLLFMTLNQYHGSSIAMFDQYVQVGEGSEYVEPVFGTPRPIRSDEWLVATPDRLSAQYGEDPYSQYNYIMRAAKTPNIANGGMYCSYAALANPFVFFFFILGPKYGLSLYWYGIIVLTFLVSIEMCMIISKKNKLVSVMGACLILFSGYYQWWIPVTWILGAQAAVVCGYHFIHTSKRPFRILLGIGLGLSLAYFITILYPAWQVPVSYLFLGIVIWILWEARDRIKQLDKFDWMILILSIVFAASIVIAYLYANTDYVNGIMNTVYPGKRVSVGGGDNVISKLFWWFYNPLFVVPGKNFVNASEGGSFMTFFPIPLILSCWYLFCEKKKDIFVIVILAITIFLGSYVIFGWPEIVAKVSLMSYSTSERAVDILMFSQVYLLVAVLSRFQEKRKLPLLMAGVITAICLAVYIKLNLVKFPEVGVPTKYIICMSIFFIICTLGLMLKTPARIKNLVIIFIMLGAIGTGIFVHPIQKGLDVIYSKPVSQKVQQIIENDPDSAWVAVDTGIVDQQLLVANGAPTINSTNIMPNLDLWSVLDPTGQYNDVYNRYAHVVVELTGEETSFELVGADLMKLKLSYQDINKAKIKYIYSKNELDVGDNVRLEEMYGENGSYIYKVIN